MLHTYKQIVSSALDSIPSLQQILDKAWAQCQYSDKQIAQNLSPVLISLDAQATDLFHQYEQQAIEHLFLLWAKANKHQISSLKLSGQDPIYAFAEHYQPLFIDFASAVQLFEKRVGNMRKARGGKTFELLLQKCLDSIGIPAEIPKGKEIRQKLRRIDLVIPDVQTALETPDKSIFLTCKRTLRERWKQEIPQIGPNQTVYLITIDQELSEQKAQEIQSHNLIAFVPDNLKQQKHAQSSWIRKLSDLPKDLQQRVGKK